MLDRQIRRLAQHYGRGLIEEWKLGALHDQIANCRLVKHRRRVPFVLVIPRTILPIHKLAAFMDASCHDELICCGPRESNVYLEENETIDLIFPPRGPKKPYFIFNIRLDTPKSLINQTPAKAKGLIEKQERQPLTIAEGIALFMQAQERLKENTIVCLASKETSLAAVAALENGFIQSQDSYAVCKNGGVLDRDPKIMIAGD